MSQPLIVSVPHRLGRQEARRRLDRGIGRLRPELGILLSGLNYHWQGDTLNLQWEPDDARVSRPVVRELRLVSAWNSVACDGDRGKA